jgi:hypothetical protein
MIQSIHVQNQGYVILLLTQVKETEKDLVMLQTSTKKKNYKQTELILCTTNPLRQKRKKTKTELQQICLPGSF